MSQASKLVGRSSNRRIRPPSPDRNSRPLARWISEVRSPPARRSRSDSRSPAACLRRRDRSAAFRPRNARSGPAAKAGATEEHQFAGRCLGDFGAREADRVERPCFAAGAWRQRRETLSASRRDVIGQARKFWPGASHRPRDAAARQDVVELVGQQDPPQRFDGVAAGRRNAGQPGSRRPASPASAGALRTGG